MREHITVQSVESFPLSYTPQSEPYGSARVIHGTRVATIVKLTGSDGTIGWGECWGDPRLVAPYLYTEASDLLGRPVDVHEAPLQTSLANRYHEGSGGVRMAAVSGLDLALWDLQAHSYDVPLASLLGGRTREEVEAYASDGYITAARDVGRLREDLIRYKESGYTSVKIKIGLGREEDYARTEVARDVFGPRARVMVDYNTNETADSALRSLRHLSDLDVFWAEEPLPTHDTLGWILLREAGTPLAAGEALAGRHGFRDAIASHRFDIVQPDLSLCGGFTEALAIRAMTNAFNLQLSPHCWGTGVLTAATLQFLAALPVLTVGDVPLIEHDQGDNPLHDGVLLEGFDVGDGRMRIPDGVGLGVHVNEGWLRSAMLTEHAVSIRC